MNKIISFQQKNIYLCIQAIYTKHKMNTKFKLFTSTFRYESTMHCWNKVHQIFCVRVLSHFFGEDLCLVWHYLPSLVASHVRRKENKNSSCHWIKIWAKNIQVNQWGFLISWINFEISMKRRLSNWILKNHCNIVHSYYVVSLSIVFSVLL